MIRSSDSKAQASSWSLPWNCRGFVFIRSNYGKPSTLHLGNSMRLRSCARSNWSSYMPIFFSSVGKFDSCWENIVANHNFRMSSRINRFISLIRRYLKYTRPTNRRVARFGSQSVSANEKWKDSTVFLELWTVAGTAKYLKWIFWNFQLSRRAELRQEERPDKDE